MVKDGRKEIQIRSQVAKFKNYTRQRLKKTSHNGKAIIITPLDNFFKNIKRGIGVVSQTLEQKALQAVAEHSYRKTEQIIDNQLSKEAIRQQVIDKSQQAKDLPQTRTQAKLVTEKQLKDVSNKDSCYKTTQGSSLRQRLAKLLKLDSLYIMIDGLQVFQNTGPTDSRECKVGTILRQSKGKIYELATWCSWDRVKAFRTLAGRVMALLSSAILRVPIIVVSDGAKWIRNLRKYIPCLKQAVWILDWFHLKDHLLKLLKVFEIDEQTKTAQDLIELLWQGKLKETIHRVSQLPKSKAEEKREKEDEATEKFFTYLDNQQEGIVNYQAYQQQGHIVGSGYVEKLNDTLVKRRMVNQKRMRWSRQGGEAMMALLTAQHNGRLAELFV